MKTKLNRPTEHTLNLITETMKAGKPVFAVYTKTKLAYYIGAGDRLACLGCDFPRQRTGSGSDMDAAFTLASLAAWAPGSDCGTAWANWVSTGKLQVLNIPA